MTSRKTLNEKEIEELLTAEDSEFEIEDSDCEISDNNKLFNPKKDVNVMPKPLRTANLFDVVMGDDNNLIRENSPEIGEAETEDIEFVDEIEQFAITEKKNIKFRRRDFTPEKIEFEPIPESNNDIDFGTKTPKDYFSKYLPTNFYEKMATYTNLYAEQNGVTSRAFKHTNSEEIMKFIGVHMIMSTMKLPQIEMYWNKHLQIESVTSVLSCKRFFQLRTNFHLINNLDIPRECKDKFIKCRPIIDSVLKRCRELPVEETISIDEQIIPFTGHLNVKQYIKGKPCPWGIKVYMLCGKSGYPYEFILYQGSNTEISKSDSIRFGHSAATVLHLMKRISNSGHKLYMDNFFCNYQLLEILYQKKINAAGTIRTNRFSNPQFLSDSDLRKKGRGSSDQLTSRDGKIVIVKWYDNKSVYLASNFVGKNHESEVRRYDKKNKNYVVILQPQIVHMYNFGMGGVDLLDQMISYYRIFMKSKKWTLRIIFHFIDVAVCASWIEYRQESKKSGIPENKTIPLLEFKQILGRSLTAVVQHNRNSGRPSEHNFENIPNNYIRAEVRPIQDVQYDRIDHFPDHDNSNAPTRCKNKKCTGRSRVMCKKCKVHLCLTKDRNCFYSFHNK